MGKKSAAELYLQHMTLSEIVDLYGDHVGLSTPDGKPIKNGFKNPNTLVFKESLHRMSKAFPNINFVVTVRHPVLWFESYYNFRLVSGVDMPRPEETIGPCGDQCENKHECIDKRIFMCTGKAKFHQFLSRLGWTPLNTDDEKSLLQHHKMSLHSFPDAKLFLMEISQLRADNRTRADIFIEDLERFVGMENSIPKLKVMTKTVIKQIKKLHTYRNGVNREEVDKKMIKICDDKHKMLREHLVSIGKDASDWIEKYFLRSHHVFVSDKEYFLELIRRWKFDPCEQARETDN